MNITGIFEIKAKPQGLIPIHPELTFRLGHDTVVYFVEKTRNGRENGGPQSLKVIRKQFNVPLIETHRATVSDHRVNDNLARGAKGFILNYVSWCEKISIKRRMIPTCSKL